MSQGDISFVEQLRNTGNNRWHYSAAGQQALLPPVETGSPFSQQAMQHDSDSNRPLKGSSRLWHDDVKQQGFSDKHRSSENSMHLSHNDFKQHESKDKHQASTDAKHGSRSNYVPLGDCGTWTSIEVQPMPADFSNRRTIKAFPRGTMEMALIKTIRKTPTQAMMGLMRKWRANASPKRCRRCVRL